MTLEDALQATRHLRTIRIAAVGGFGIEDDDRRMIDVDYAVSALKADPMAPVTIQLDSIGGRVSQAQRLADAIEEHAGPVALTVTNRCYSAAILPFLAADVRLGYSYAGILFHRCAVEVRDETPIDRMSAAELRELADSLDLLDAGIDARCAEVTGKPVSFFRSITADNHIMLADEAVEIGLLDGVAPSLLHPRAKRRRLVSTPLRWAT